MTKLFMWRGPYDFILEAKEHQIELESKARKMFYSSNEFANIFSTIFRTEVEQKMKAEKVKLIFKDTNNFIKDYKQEHTNFIKFVTKRIKEINNISIESDIDLKQKELDVLNRIIELFYNHSDRAYDEFDKTK